MCVCVCVWLGQKVYKDLLCNIFMNLKLLSKIKGFCFVLKKKGERKNEEGSFDAWMNLEDIG